jgi:hypothetical protein
VLEEQGYKVRLLLKEVAGLTLYFLALPLLVEVVQERLLYQTLMVLAVALEAVLVVEMAIHL